MKISKDELVKIITEEIAEAVATSGALKKQARSTAVQKQVSALSTQERGIQQELQGILAFISDKKVNVKLSGKVKMTLDRFKEAIGMPAQPAAAQQQQAAPAGQQQAAAAPAQQQQAAGQQRQGVSR